MGVDHLIALNTKHFADKSKNNRGYAETQTSEQLDELLRQEVAPARCGRHPCRAGGEEGLAAVYLSALHGLQGQSSCTGLHHTRGFHVYDVCGYRQPQAGASGLRESFGGKQG